MAGVNAYGATSNDNAVWGTDKKGNSVVKSDSDLSMDDFLNMLTAQMSNQDPMNPSTDMEFIGQMAQFTSLQAMKTLTELSMAQHGSTLIGKHVIVAHVDDRGQLVNEKGVVSNVKFMGGVVSLTVNGNEYEMSSVMEILTEEEFNKPEKPEEKPEEPDVDDPKAEQRTDNADQSKKTNVDVLSDSAYAYATSATDKYSVGNVVHSKEEIAASNIRAAKLAVSDPEFYAEIKPYLDGGYILAESTTLNYNTVMAQKQAESLNSTEVKSDSRVVTPVGEVNVQSATATTKTTTTPPITQAESDARAAQLAISNPELYAEIKAMLDSGYKLAPSQEFNYNELFGKNKA